MKLSPADWTIVEFDPFMNMEDALKAAGFRGNRRFTAEQIGWCGEMTNRVSVGMAFADSPGTIAQHMAGISAEHALAATPLILLAYIASTDLKHEAWTRIVAPYVTQGSTHVMCIRRGSQRLHVRAVEIDTIWQVGDCFLLVRPQSRTAAVQVRIQAD